MNEKESQILHLIKDNPFITQNEIAGKLNLSRSAIAGYISSLTKQGKLLGRAYVLPEGKRIVCIGGANMDRKSSLEKAFRLETSNPVQTTSTLGGVARNIAENLGRIGADVHLLTVVGDDREGKDVLARTGEYVKILPSLEIAGHTTGTYTAILDEHGNMAVAFADMGIYDAVDIPFIEKRWSHIAASSMVLLDTNFPKEIISYIIGRCADEGIPVSVVPVSIPKLDRLPENLSGLEWLILNREEAEVLSGLTVNDDESVREAGAKILARGVRHVIITRSEKGLYFINDKGEEGFLTGQPADSVVDVTGAGDSLAAGIMLGAIEGHSILESCQYGMSSASITIQSKETVSPSLNRLSLEKEKERLF
ncbi:carbohydrate kinase [Gracilibacillus sp. Marseille-QA3620]